MPQSYSSHDKWYQLITDNGLFPDHDQIQQLIHYHENLILWNSKVNLISRKDEENVWANHILHSISPLFTIDIPEGVVVADIGTGGGLPGIPLAIMLPKVELLLIESIKKKCVALIDMVTRLSLKNVKIINARAEDVVKLKEREKKADVVFARAVAPLRDLVKWSSTIVCHDSRFMMSMRTGERVETQKLPVLIALKGGELNEEITQAKGGGIHNEIRSVDIQFKGMETTGLVDKKMIVVAL